MWYVYFVGFWVLTHQINRGNFSIFQLLGRGLGARSSLGLGPLSWAHVKCYMCMIYDALSRPDKGCHVGYECLVG